MNADEHFRRWLITISLWRLIELYQYKVVVFPPGHWSQWTADEYAIAGQIDYRLNTLVKEEFERRRVRDLTAV